MVVAMLIAVAEVCGLTVSFCALAIAAMRIASVTPPVFDRSGCTNCTWPSSSSVANS